MMTPRCRFDKLTEYYDLDLIENDIQIYMGIMMSFIGLVFDIDIPEISCLYYEKRRKTCFHILVLI